MVQWLRLCTPSEGGLGSIPGQAPCHDQVGGKLGELRQV